LAATEPQRLALHAAARAALGPEEGDTLMALTPPANTDMATMQALDRVEERLGARIDRVEERLGARIDTVEEQVGARITETAAELRGHTWKVVVGTGVVLYLATVSTAFAGFDLLLRALERV
jgi:hypothetical protein